MKKIISFLLASVLCLSLMFGAFASEFVPSISYKDGPDIKAASLKGEDVSGCVTVTTLKGAEEKTTDISEEERAYLLSVYEKLTSGEMKLPLKNKYVIRELVDVSFMYNACRNVSSHGEKEADLAEEGASLKVNFDLGIAKDENLKVLVCVNNEWKPVKSTIINDDGTVTVEFDEICPVAFCIETEESVDVPDENNNIGSIIAIATAIAAVLAALILLAMKFLKKK